MKRSLGQDAALADAYDVVVVGAGAGGMTAAAVAASRGLSVLLVEKTPWIGGTTATSGGMVWAPNAAPTPPGATPDTPEQARRYLEAVVASDQGQELRRHFLAKAPAAIAYLARHTHVHLAPVPFYPDYYPETPGATLRGRVLEPLPFDARELGPWFSVLRPPLPEFTLFGGMMVARADIMHFRSMLRSARSMARAARLVARYGVQRLGAQRGTSLVLGNALAGRLLKSLLERDVTIRVATPVTRLVEETGRIAGVEIRTPAGTLQSVGARRGVVLASGGFSHNAGLRRELLPAESGDSSAAAEGNTGDGLVLGVAAGGLIGRPPSGGAFWTPVSKFTRPDGTPAVFPHTVTDRGKPGMLAVDKTGRRFTNEAESYHAFVSAMFRANQTSPAIPAFLICDRRALWTYGLGAIQPMTLRLGRYLKSGYLQQASSIDELAGKIGVDAANLGTTIATYNRDALSGNDSAFGRGSNAYHTYVGDAANHPNPCMRPLATAPFSAVALFPADLGTAAGLETSCDGEVLDAEQRPIPGLYACGNDMNSIMAGSYPGPGITLGPALVFGTVVGTHLADGGA